MCLRDLQENTLMSNDIFKTQTQETWDVPWPREDEYQSFRLDKPQEMKRDGHFTPDEIMYNSIIDGCTKQRNVTEALRVLEAEGVAS